MQNFHIVMIKKLEEKICKIIKIIENGDLSIEQELKQLELFLLSNKKSLYDYLNSLEFDDWDEKIYDKLSKNQHEYFMKWMNYYIDAYDIESLKSSHIAETYEWLLYCVDVFKWKDWKQHSYDSLHEILFELYEHLLPHHIVIFFEN